MHFLIKFLNITFNTVGFRNSVGVIRIQTNGRTDEESHCNALTPSSNYMYHQFNIQQFYVLPTQCIYVFCVDLRTNSDYCLMQH